MSDDEQQANGIDELGFMSPDISEWIAKHRAAFREWFALTDALNRLGHLQIKNLEVAAEDNQSVLSALLFLRGLSMFQGAALLTERGMTVEGRTLVRGCFETAFCLGAVRKDETFAEAFIHDDADRRGKLARALLRLGGRSALQSDERVRLLGFLDDLTVSGREARPLHIEDAAKRAGMGEVYDTYYRVLSGDAAHPSVVALDRHVRADDSRTATGFHWGPDVRDVGDTITAACTACIYLINWMRELSDSTDIGNGVAECWARYKSLVAAAVEASTQAAAPSPQRDLAGDN